MRQDALHAAGARATRTPGRATCTTASTTGSTASVGYAGFTRHGRRRAASASARASSASSPDGSRKLRFLRSTNNNTWGVGFSEEGLLFGSTANGSPSVYMPIPNRYYEKVRGLAPTVLQNIADRTTTSSRSPTRCGRSTGTAASPPAPDTRSTPPAPTRRNTGTAPRSSPSRPAT